MLHLNTIKSSLSLSSFNLGEEESIVPAVDKSAHGVSPLCPYVTRLHV